MRLALSDVMRLQIAVRYEEVRPGVLVLELGSGYAASRSRDYNLQRLYMAYRELNYPARYPIIELWQNGEKIGTHSRKGLQVEPTRVVPR